MPVKHAIWKIGPEPKPLSTTTLLSEQQLEDMIVAAPQILSDQWMLIGRQEPTKRAVSGNAQALKFKNADWE